MRTWPVLSLRKSIALCTCLLFSIFGLLWFSHGQQPTTKDKTLKSPLTPPQEQATFHLPEDLRIELIAAEPQVQSPVAMSFDEEGKLWVVEMADYPNGPAPGKSPDGRVVILQDKDGDGLYEHRSVFADKLLFANGLLHWKDGVIVTQAPNIIFLRDTDGDGKADKQEVLYEGFTAENPQLRVSHPNLGLDNWIYVANGLRGGKVKAAGEPDAKGVSLSGMDFRFDPISKRYEAISGLGQFGNTFDDWGNRFVCDNRHHLRHIILPNHYLKRNPFLAVPAVLEDVSELDDGPLSSGGKIYPLSKNWTTSNLHAGRFTAACGVYIYRGGLLHFDYNGNAFTCDPTGNLVHAERLTPKGATFSAKPLFKEKEFLASPDDWFRPVFLNDGPDGALYVVDMYRAVIEHPQFMPPELKNRPDLLLGKDKGRIWRIVPKGHKSSAIHVNLSKATAPELVPHLFSHKGWYRTTAQRLLLQRQDKEAIPPLKEACLSRKDAKGRVLAAWLLHSLSEMDEPLLLKLLVDSHPRIREQAVLLAEKKLKDSKNVRDQVLRMATDPDAKVRFQVALSLGEWDDAKILQPLAKIALAGAEDSWTRQAVYSSAAGRAGTLVHYLLEPSVKFTKNKTGGRDALFQELSQLVGARGDQDEVRKLLGDFLQIPDKTKVQWQLLGLHGLAQGLGQRGKQLSTVVASFPKEYKGLTDKINILLASTAKIARTDEINLPARLTAISLLAHVSWDTAKPALIDLLENDPLKEIRLAAVRSLSAHSQPEVAELLLKSWKGYTPALRGAATEALLRNATWTQALLAEVEAGRIKPGDLNSLTINRLFNHKQPQISARAQKLLKSNLPAARLKVIAQYQAALKMKGDIARGQKVFEKNCATCHKVGKTGIDVGPDISDSRTKTPEAYLADILNPNQAIDNNYVNYLVMTKTGKVISGIITTETAASLTLRRAANESDVVLRQDIDEITSTGVSLMPEGLEKDISLSEMADLLSFLKNWRYLDGEVPIGQGG